MRRSSRTSASRGSWAWTARSRTRTILVSRPGDAQRNIFTTGKEPLKALKTSETATFDVGAMPVQDKGSDRQDMDYQVIVRRGGAEVAKVESKPNFSQLIEAARPLAKKRKKDK